MVKQFLLVVQRHWEQMKSDKASKKPKDGSHHGDWHSSHTSMGMGDYYGTGVRAPIGKMRSGMGMQKVSKKGLKTPPRSVV